MVQTWARGCCLCSGSEQGSLHSKRLHLKQALQTVLMYLLIQVWIWQRRRDLRVGHRDLEGGSDSAESCPATSSGILLHISKIFLFCLLNSCWSSLGIILNIHRHTHTNMHTHAHMHTHWVWLLPFSISPWPQSISQPAHTLLPKEFWCLLYVLPNTVFSLVTLLSWLVPEGILILWTAQTMTNRQIHFAVRAHWVTNDM